MKHVVRAVGWTGWALLAAGGLLLLLNLWVIWSSQPRMFYALDTLPVQPVALVLGTSSKTSSGKPNQFFGNRMDAAAALYRGGKVSRMIVSGDNRSSRYYNEPQQMKTALQERGVPADAILIDGGGVRTLESVSRCRTVFGEDRITIVTQGFHGYRALFISQRLGMEANVLVARGAPFSLTAIRVHAREFFARAVNCLILFFPVKKVFAVVLSACCMVATLPQSHAQETVIRGKVTDAGSGDPIPFASVVLTGTSVGATTDFEGNYLIRTTHPSDSLVARYVGYKPRTKAIKKGIAQVVNFQLEEEVTRLQEVVVLAGENPAFEIMRQVVRNKPLNNKDRLRAVEMDTYTKIEVDVDNISEKFREKKIMRKVTQVLDSIDRLAGEDGKPVLPLFIAETVSKVYHRTDPLLKKELILKTKLSGVGVEDGSLVTQLIGSSFQEYNFYQNWLTILTKEFVSPLTDLWRLYYNYDLTDSLYVGDHFCYRLDFAPKTEKELAFSGTIWITKKEFALRQIHVTMGAQANINFIEKLKIQQELQPTEAGPWLPMKNRVLIDIGELSKSSAGMLAKFYTSNRNPVVNRPMPASFYDRPIVLAEDARMFYDEKYWDTLRHEPLSPGEVNVYKMIDTLKNIPIVRTYTDIVKFVLDGYMKVGKVDVGPHLGFFTWNNIEGIRLQGGFKTNYHFSKKYVFGAQVGYGFEDGRVKYDVMAKQILDRHRWTTLTVRTRYDLQRMGVDDEALADNPLFLTATRWGIFRRGFYTYDTRATWQREMFKGFSQKVGVRYWTFEPTYSFGFIENPGEVAPVTLDDHFQAAEVFVESRYARDELFLVNDNDRVSLGTRRSPTVVFRYTRGFEGILGSDFNYHKFRFSIDKRIKTGPLGVGYASLTGEYIANPVPYPLLALHLGNQSPFYSPITYNLMNFGEFISDHYVSLRYRQYLEGFLLNHMPVLKRLNWRLVATSNMIMGGMRESNRLMISRFAPDGEAAVQAGYFNSAMPYIEMGYGVENIFRFLRVDFVHRLTYLDRPDARRFGVLFTVQFQL
jgi:vancomycin permeability regulator SanA